MNTNIFDPSQLDIRPILIEALLDHYGYEMNEGGKLIEVRKNVKKFVPPVNDLRLRSKTIFITKHIGAVKSMKFFDAAMDAAKPDESNFTQVTRPAKTWFLFPGIMLTEASGTSGLTQDALSYTSPQQDDIINARMDFKVNGVDELDKEPITPGFQASGIPDFYRLGKMLVWEPNEAAELDLYFPSNVDDYWVKIALPGYELY